MIANSSPAHFTAEEYLEWELQQDVRYEYIEGEVVAMTGGTFDRLRTNECRVFPSG